MPDWLLGFLNQISSGDQDVSRNLPVLLESCLWSSYLDIHSSSILPFFSFSECKLNTCHIPILWLSTVKGPGKKVLHLGNGGAWSLGDASGGLECDLINSQREHQERGRSHTTKRFLSPIRSLQFNLMTERNARRLSNKLWQYAWNVTRYVACRNAASYSYVKYPDWTRLPWRS